MRLRISGFTLMELIITILVMTILLGIGVPSYLKFKEDNLLQGAAQSLHADIQFARSEAIKRSSDVTVYFFRDAGDNTKWCYRISDNAACQTACSYTCDSTCNASCDIHGDGIARGGSHQDFPKVSLSDMTYTDDKIKFSGQRGTADEGHVHFSYGDKVINVETNMLGRTLMCTPSGQSGVMGVGSS